MNALLAGLHFLRPHWLWALLALPALWWLWRLRRQRGNVWRETVDPHLLPHLLQHGDKALRGLLGTSAPWLGSLGYVLAVLALAGPSWRQGEQPLWQSQTPLVVALDLSSRIGAADLPPSRLLQVRAKLATLLNERTGGQVALIAYAGEAFTVAPLTDDASNVALFLDALEPDVMPVDGQDAAVALNHSARLLKQAGFDRGDILVVGDHADASALAAATKLRLQGYRVSALGVGTVLGAAYRDLEGRFQHASLDAASLRALAAAGGGAYAALVPGDADLRALGVLDPQAGGAASARGQKGLAWLDEGYWLLPPLLLLGLFAFRRNGVAAVLVLGLVLPLASPAQAADTDWWRRVDQQRHTRIEQGAQAYRKGDFASAEKAFSDMHGADGAYNRGNALAKQGRYDEAIAAYDEALKLRPGMDDAIANKKAVEAAKKRQQQNGQGKNNKSQGGSQGNQQQNSQQQKSGQPQGQSTQQGQQGKQESQSPSGSGNQQSSSPQNRSQRNRGSGQPADASTQAEDEKAQRDADAAQKQRMQQAMAQAAKSGEKNDANGRAVAPAETAEQRERRQATEAWLRRVPDDPGGLLRAKFRLEYERRRREGQ